MRSIPVESLGEILDISAQIEDLISECQPYSPDDSKADEFMEDLAQRIDAMSERFDIMEKVVKEWRRIYADDAKRKLDPMKKGKTVFNEAIKKAVKS